MTRAEQLQKKLGKPVECDYHHKKGILTEQWMMTEGSQVMCPECCEKHPEKIKVSI